VLRRPGDEWRCGEVLDAFDARGVVRVYDYVEGAVLIERLNPGTSLASVALDGRDGEATEILAGVIERMARPRETLRAFDTVWDWGKGFERYLSSDDDQIPTSLTEQARRTYSELCESQQSARLLHGDLQHYNVVFDVGRGWLAIDPKGVVGEVEYEIGASLRNPYEAPELLASPETVKRRLKHYEAKLKLDGGRALRWGFAQAVLSAIWCVEDGCAIDGRNPSLMLANVIRQVLG
jgi:streptomycin 6-kinase